MELYIKQKIFSFGDKYDIFDEQGNVVFDVKSELLAIGAKMHLFDMGGNERYYIRQKITFICHRYEIYKGDYLCAVVQQELALFKTKLSILSEFGNFVVDGNIFDMNYQIFKDGLLVGAVQKKWLSWSDTYELSIPDNSDAAFFAALVIAIDNCSHNGDR